MARFTLALSVGLLAGSAMAAEAQRVRLEVTPEGTPPVPHVRAPGLLRDPRWLESLQNSFPLRLRFRIEIWRVRTDWFDALERSFEWETVVQYEPLMDQYVRTDIWGGAPRRIDQFVTLPELERNLEAGWPVILRPPGPGEYYYSVILNLRTLTESEIDELERFLQPGSEERPRGSALSRAARRILLRFGGLPVENLEARSRRFTVSGR